jgi:hypothetical protein
VICRDSSIRWRVLEPRAGSPSERRSATANPSLSSSFISFGWKFRIKLRPLWVRLEGDSHCCQPTESRPHLPHDIDPGLCFIRKWDDEQGNVIIKTEPAAILLIYGVRPDGATEWKFVF